MWEVTPVQKCSRCILQLQLTGVVYLFKMVEKNLLVPYISEDRNFSNGFGIR